MAARAAALLCSCARTFALVAACALVLWLLDVGCVVRFVTGVPCPGCGMTRAWLALLRGDLAAALAYHPMFWSFPLAVALAHARSSGLGSESGALVRRCIDAALVLLLASLVVLWAVRLASPRDAALLLGGSAPAGVPADVVGIHAPAWLSVLGGSFG